MSESSAASNQIPPVKQAKASPFWGRGVVVGTIHSAGGVAAAQALAAGALSAGVLSAVELRLDAFAEEELSVMCRALAAGNSTGQLPRILTPRCASEGGARAWDVDERLRTLAPLLPWADAVDLEWAAWTRLSSVREAVTQAGVSLIASVHDFSATPATGQLLEARQQAAAAGADVFKVATTLRSPGDLTSLLALLDPQPPLPTAVMAMGPLGQSARLFLAAAGSALNYGWLDCPQVEGQWSAVELRELFQRLAIYPG